MKVETRTSTGVDHPIRYKIAADHPLRDLAEGVADMYLDIIIGSIVNQPRSLQKRIGPSEMGVDCRRAILHKLNGDPEPARGSVPWKPTIGTAVHTYLEEAFDKASAPGQEQAGTWITEQRVLVGKVGPTDITGSTDLYNVLAGAVMDHKVVGNSTLKTYKAHGPSPQYRRQAHTYGKGWEDRGYDVKMVMICFLPREGELNDAFIWSEPYDRAVAEETIAKCDKLWTLLQAIGIDQALALYPECDDRWCKWCGTGNSFGAQPMPSSTAALFNP